MMAAIIFIVQDTGMCKLIQYLEKPSENIIPVSQMMALI